MPRLIPKYFVVAVIAMALVVVVFGSSNRANAEEINPAPGSYSYGSTSEFSPYFSIGQGPNPTPTPTPDGLAPTGQNTWLLYMLAIVLIASPVVYFGISKTKS